MDMEWLKELVGLVETSEVDGLDIELIGKQPGDPTRVRIRKSPRVAAGISAAAHAVPASPPPPAAAASPPEAPGAAAASEPSSSSSALMEVLSPMVGTFYRAPAVDADPFVSVGDRVEKGQTLCILEAMKLMNELQADAPGFVREIVVENAEPVEFGEVLFRIEPA